MGFVNNIKENYLKIAIARLKADKPITEFNMKTLEEIL